MSTVSVRTHFAAGHRILGLTGEGAKCRNLHGHTFNVTWTLQQDDSLEFGTLKSILRGVVRHHFDHHFIIDKTDDLLHYLEANDLWHYTLDGPPTTEAIAAEIAKLSIAWLTEDRGDNGESSAPYPTARLLRVSVDEGPENNATWEAPVYVSPSNTLTMTPNTTWGSMTVYGSGSTT
jgi:6-pyruvoyl-tetrahydropterin synthase